MIDVACFPACRSSRPRHPNNERMIPQNTRPTAHVVHSGRFAWLTALLIDKIDELLFGMNGRSALANA